ncbi:MAG: GtrA family protein [Bacillota bacterium]|nr:GtrA family protein [Bacillota bacterium]
MYIIMGVFTTIVNIASFYILVEIMNVDYKAATVAAWILSVLFAYITNKLYVFQQKTHDLQSLLKELTAFFSVRVLSLGIDLGMMIILVGQFNTNETLAKILDNAVIVVVNYVASK